MVDWVHAEWVIGMGIVASVKNIANSAVKLFWSRSNKKDDYYIDWVSYSFDNGNRDSTEGFDNQEGM